MRTCPQMNADSFTLQTVGLASLDPPYTKAPGTIHGGVPMRLKTTVALLVLAAAGAAVYWFAPTAAPPPGPPAAARALADLTPASVESLRVTRRGEPIAELKRSGAGWVVDGNWPASPAEVQTTLAAVCGLTTRF